MTRTIDWGGIYHAITKAMMSTDASKEDLTKATNNVWREMGIPEDADVIKIQIQKTASEVA